MNVHEYVIAEYGNAMALYKSLGSIRTLSDQKKSSLLHALDLIDESIDALDDQRGTPMRRGNSRLLIEPLPPQGVFASSNRGSHPHSNLNAGGIFFLFFILLLKFVQIHC